MTRQVAHSTHPFGPWLFTCGGAQFKWALSRFQKIKFGFVPFDILARMDMKNNIFRDVTPCSLVEFHRRLGVTFCLHLQDGRISQVSNRQEWSSDSNLKMEEVISSETSANFCQITWCHIPEDSSLLKWNLLLDTHKNPLIVARQRLGGNVTAVINTKATIEELLDPSFPMWPVSYQKK
jgi:hypothetical protein